MFHLAHQRVALSLSVGYIFDVDGNKLLFDNLLWYRVKTLLTPKIHCVLYIVFHVLKVYCLT